MALLLVLEVAGSDHSAEDVDGAGVIAGALHGWLFVAIIYPCP